ncbi:MAG: sulfatase-like hydrolase/transferase [Candidatus Aminicenantes bacterium]|nr:sulfatase-like hydrolase/transferase [Candidatus Aminicenantes bacterium]
MTEKYKAETFRIIWYSVVGACLGGWTLAIFNILAEMIRGESIFGIGDIFPLSLWHIAAAAVLGFAAGCILAVIRLLLKKRKSFSSASYIYPAVFLSVFFFIFGYANIYYISGFFSGKSLFWNVLLLAAGVVFFVGMCRFFSRHRSKTIPMGIKIYAACLFVLTSVSLLVVLGVFSFGRRRSLSLRDKSHKPYNVILIVLDALRYDHVGCNGYERETTPNIDRLAERGTVFEKAFANSSHTIESVASYMSSVYPSTHNVQTLTTALPDDLVILPEIFSSFGYKTSVFSVNPYVTPVFGYGRGVEDFFWLEGNVIKANRTVLGYVLQNAARLSFLSAPLQPFLDVSRKVFASGETLPSGDAGTVTQSVKKWIGKNVSDPFFISIHYHGGHAPYHPPPPFDRMFDPSYSGKLVQRFPEGLGMFLPFVKGKSLDLREKQNMVAQYDGQIRFHDEQCGGLFAFLKEKGLEDKTIVVLTSDHGEEFYEHEGWGHGQSLYDELIHVPLIMSCPGYISSGRRIGGLVELVDLFPTILGLCGMSDGFDLPYEIEGRDMSFFLFGQAEGKGRERIFSEVNYGGHFGRVLRTGDLKSIYLRYGNNVLRYFYDLAADPLEKNNVFDRRTEEALRFFSQMEAVIERAEKKSFQGKKTSVENKQKEQLKALGYVRD